MWDDIEEENRNPDMEVRRKKEKAYILKALAEEQEKPDVVQSEVSDLTDDQTALRKYLQEHKDPERIGDLNERLGVANDPAKWAEYEAQREKIRDEELIKEEEERQKQIEKRRKEKIRRARSAGRVVDPEMSFSDTSESHEELNVKKQDRSSKPEPVNLSEIDLGQLPTATVTPM